MGGTVGFNSSALFILKKGEKVKFFVISDMHSYYDPMIKALNEAGFDKNNADHTLIVCGDAFDRGSQSFEVLEYINSLEQKVLVKGNHDDMLVELLERKIPNIVDDRNGTLGTVYQLGFESSLTVFSDFCDIAYKKYKPFYDSMVNYFETKNYIFVHSWIPLIRMDNLPKYYVHDRKWAFNDDWRNATEDMWDDARWGNPYELAAMGLKPDKTVVFGHWHTSWPRARYEGKEEFGSDADFSIYYGDGYIGIDACTAASGKVNVLVIEDEFLK